MPLRFFRRQAATIGAFHRLTAARRSLSYGVSIMAKSLSLRLVLFAVVAAGIVTDLQAGPLRDRLRERLQERAAESAEQENEGGGALSCADWARRVDRLQTRAAAAKPGPQPDLKDVAYGNGQREKLDVYLPAKGGDVSAPVIVMVHGGGWCIGDKAMAGVTENKVARWADRGLVFVSINYPMVNEGSDALAQANHVARAIAYRSEEHTLNSSH